MFNNSFKLKKRRNFAIRYSLRIVTFGDSKIKKKKPVAAIYLTVAGYAWILRSITAFKCVKKVLRWVNLA